MKKNVEKLSMLQLLNGDPNMLLEDYGMTGKDKLEEIERRRDAGDTVGIYSTVDIPVTYRKNKKVIKKGFHQYDAQFAIYVLSRFGEEQKYGVNRMPDGTYVPPILDYKPNDAK